MAYAMGKAFLLTGMVATGLIALSKKRSWAEYEACRGVDHLRIWQERSSGSYGRTAGLCQRLYENRYGFSIAITIT